MTFFLSIFLSVDLSIILYLEPSICQSIQLSIDLDIFISICDLISVHFLCIFFPALIFTWGTWNGASYYIEVFSKRYNIQFAEELNRQRALSESATSTSDVAVEHIDNECQTTTGDEDSDEDGKNGSI